MKLTQNKYGFSYGPLKVTRIHSSDDLGCWIEVSGAREYVQIRVTKTGLVRVTKPIKHDKQTFYLPEHT